MILYPALLATMVLAGGPAATTESNKNKHWKRSTQAAVTEYVAITSFPKGPNGDHYCLRNMGASMAGLLQCAQPNLTDAMSLFTFQTAPGYSKGDGNYTMKSAFDSLCNAFIVLFKPYT